LIKLNLPYKVAVSVKQNFYYAVLTDNRQLVLFSYPCTFNIGRLCSIISN